METLKNLNKLWRTTTLLPSTITTTYSDASDYRVYNTTKVLSEEEEDEEESFFELEVVMLNNKTKEEENERLRQSSNEVNNGRRVVPVEPDMKRQHPQSPSQVSILKSTPKFKVSLFKKHINNNTGKISDPKMKQRPKIDDEEKEKLSATTISTLIRENSSISSTNHVSKHRMKKCKTEYNNNNDDDDSVSTDSVSIDSSSTSSNRFSKDMMHKYFKLKLIKPIHLKLAKRSASLNNNSTNRSSSTSSSSSSSASISSSNGYGFRVVCKQLRKSRSASSMMVGSTRRDESLMVQHDDDGGIQSAILHCKKSFNSSTVSSTQSSSKCSEQVTSS